MIMPAIPCEKREGFMPARCQYWKRQVLPSHSDPPMVGTPPPGAEAALLQVRDKARTIRMEFFIGEAGSSEAWGGATWKLTGKGLSGNRKCATSN